MAAGGPSLSPRPALLQTRRWRQQPPLQSEWKLEGYLPVCLFRAVIGAGGVWPGMELHCSRERTNDLCSTSSKKKKKKAACLLCALRQIGKFHRPRHDVPGVPTAGGFCNGGGGGSCSLRWWWWWWWWWWLTVSSTYNILMRSGSIWGEGVERIKCT